MYVDVGAQISQTIYEAVDLTLLRRDTIRGYIETRFLMKIRVYIIEFLLYRWRVTLWVSQSQALNVLADWEFRENQILLKETTGQGSNDSTSAWAGVAIRT